MQKDVYEAGMVFETANFGRLTIVEYVGWDNVIVRFEDTGYTTRTRSWLIKTGVVRDNLKPISYGVGYIGDGPHQTREGKKRTIEYMHWRSMLDRCYGATTTELYKECSVCEDWLNFQNFAQWYKDYAYIKECWHLDKDILIKGNKVYRPEACTFVSSHVNVVVTTKPKRDLPAGVAEQDGFFRAYISNSRGRMKHLGRYSTMEQANSAYLEAKKLQIKEVTEKFKDDLDPRVYQALMSWEVLIDD